MKMNIFSEKHTAHFAGGSPYSSLTGRREDGPLSPEDEIIQQIDESRMAPQAVRIERFRTFLGDRRLSTEKFQALPSEEQERLKTEFFSTLD